MSNFISIYIISIKKNYHLRMILLFVQYINFIIITIIILVCFVCFQGFEAFSRIHCVICYMIEDCLFFFWLQQNYIRLLTEYFHRFDQAVRDQ